MSLRALLSSSSTTTSAAGRTTRRPSAPLTGVRKRARRCRKSSSPSTAALFGRLPRALNALSPEDTMPDYTAIFEVLGQYARAFTQLDNLAERNLTITAGGETFRSLDKLREEFVDV